MTRTHRSLEGRGLVPIHRVRHDLVPIHPGVLRELSLREDHLDPAGPRAPRARVLRGRGEGNEPSRRPKPAAAGATMMSPSARAVARSRRMMMMFPTTPPFATPTRVAGARLGRDGRAGRPRGRGRGAGGRARSVREPRACVLHLPSVSIGASVVPAQRQRHPPPPDARSRSRSPSPAVGRDATDEDIKRAYRNLAQVAHPDKHASPAMREVRLAALPPPLPRRLGPPAAVRFSLRRRRTRVHLERASAPVSSLAPGTSTPPPPPRSPRPPSSLPASRNAHPSLSSVVRRRRGASTR